MKRYLIVSILLLSVRVNAQPIDIPFGAYCFDENVCTNVFSDLYIDGIDKGNIYVGDGELKKYMFDSKTETYFYSENSVKKLQACFIKKENGTVMRLIDLSDASYFDFNFVGKEELQEESQEDYGSGFLHDSGGYDYGMDEEPMMGYYDNELVDIELVSNPQHIQNEEFFNPKKNPKIPFELVAYDFSSKSRINDIFEMGQPIPEDVFDKIVAIFEFTSFQYTSVTCYAVYNETDQTHDCYTENNKLYVKIKFTDNFMYAHFLDLKTKQEIGVMNVITGESEEFTPPGYLLPGTYTLLDGSNGTLILEAANDETESMKLEFSSSPYGSAYSVQSGMESPEYSCFLVNGTKATYTFTCDKEKSGVINLKDVKTGKIVSAKFSFD